MKHIYIIDEHQSSKRNGIGTYVKELIYCLCQMEVKICIISFNSDEEEFSIIEEEGIKRIYFPFFDTYFYHDYWVIIEKFFRLYIKESEDNIFIFNYAPCLNLIKTVKLNFPSSKCIFVIHDQEWTNYMKGDIERFRNIVEECIKGDVKSEYSNILDCFYEDKKIYDFADIVICLNDDTYKLVNETYKKTENLYKINHGYRDSIFYNIQILERKELRAKLKIDLHDKILIYTGRLSEMKGTDILIKSFCNVIEEIPSARLILIGTSSTKEYYNFLLGLAKRSPFKISFLGHIPSSELRNWYSIADIGILPTYYEQCSFTGIEMMQHGLPIITSDGFGVRCMFNENNARIVKKGKNSKDYEHGLSLAIKELINSESYCENIGSNARKTYEIKYNINNMIQEYNKLFNN